MASDFRLPDPGRQNSAHDCRTLHCTKPFIITLSSSGSDLDNVERKPASSSNALTSYHTCPKILTGPVLLPVEMSAGWVVNSVESNETFILLLH